MTTCSHSAFSLSVLSPNRFIPDSGSLILSANTSACSSTASEIKKLEHVQINITLKHRHRGDLSITLISPSGTRSKLLATRRNDHSARGLKVNKFSTSPFQHIEMVCFRLECKFSGTPTSISSLFCYL